MKTQCQLLALVALVLFTRTTPAPAQPWTTYGSPSLNWAALASSADGTKLVAAATGRGPIFVSANAGTNWTLSGAPDLHPLYASWIALAASTDGTKLVAAASDGDGFNCPIYTSTNAGVSWTSNAAPSLVWTSVASSADGSRLAAAAGETSDPDYYEGAIYTSTNGGAT